MTALANVAAGGIIYASTINDLINGKANRAHCRLALPGNQSTTNVTITSVLFGASSEISDTSGWHSTSSNTSRVVPTLAGVYLCVGRIYWAASLDSGDRRAYIAVNGSQTGNWSRGFPPGTGGSYPGTSGAGVSQDVSAVVTLNGSTDYVELQGYQATGGALNITGAGDQTFSTTFDVIYLGTQI
jgi:hypothetical protein